MIENYTGISQFEIELTMERISLINLNITYKLFKIIKFK